MFSVLLLLKNSPFLFCGDVYLVMGGEVISAAVALLIVGYACTSLFTRQSVLDSLRSYRRHGSC